MNDIIQVRTKDEMRRVIDRLTGGSVRSAANEQKRNQWRMQYITMGEAHKNFTEHIYISTRDISIDGLGFESKKKLQPGDELTINITTDDDEFAVCAVVVHCTQSIGTYKVGVRFSLIDSESN